MSSTAAPPTVLPAFRAAKVDPAALKEALTQERLALRQTFEARPNAAQLLHRHTRLIDNTLIALWRSLPDEVRRCGVLMAIGGYGRSALFPHSDIDTVIVLPAALLESHGAALSAFETALWDIGLKSSHSVRTSDDVENINALDITVQTSLIEHRYLAGSRQQYQQLADGLRHHLNFERFFEAKRFEQEQRHLKYRDALYNLEPNLKESPGGLRDLHVLLWLSRAASLGNTWEDIARHGLLNPQEAATLQQQERWLSMLRIRLHYLAGRPEERLLFDHQTALAEQMSIAGKGVRQPAEVLMQRYYRAAQTIRRFNTLLLQVFEERLAPAGKAIPLDDPFVRRGNLLDLRSPQPSDRLFVDTPSALFDVFRHWQNTPEVDGLSSNVLRALNTAASGIDRAFRNNPHHRQQFIDLFRAPRGILRALRTLNLYGLLGRYLPAFGRIVGQMQHDLFHVYTVDEHTLMMVRNLRRFSRDIYNHEYPLCSRLMADFTRPEAIYLATLFHDIAKGRGGRHAQRGAVIARHFCNQHPLPEEDAALIVWLVREHLLMSHTAQKEDIADPHVVARFARRVANERRLIALYLMTVADIRATSPQVWNPWKAQLLETLFHATRARLRQGHTSEETGIADSIAEKQQAVLHHLRHTGIALDADAGALSVVETFWKQLDTAYFQRHTIEDLAWHAGILLQQSDATAPIVRARTLPQNAADLQLFVCMNDQPGLFARLCGFFARQHLSILEARIHTSRHGRALDSFVLHNNDPHSSDPLRDLEQTLLHFLRQPAPAEPPAMGRKSRRLRHFPLTPHVRITPDDGQQAFVLEITAGDCTGLLAHIAHLLSESHINVESARINTLGERVEDIFLISGSALTDPAMRVKLESRLHKLLQQP